jgi:hypothetical protein
MGLTAFKDMCLMKFRGNYEGMYSIRSPINAFGETAPTGCSFLAVIFMSEDVGLFKVGLISVVIEGATFKLDVRIVAGTCSL